MSDEADTQATYEPRAREMGWTPEADYKGDPAKFVDAKTYVERGETVLPIVKATNKRLREDLTKANTEMSDLRTVVAQSQETMKALAEYHDEDVKQKVAQAKVRLKAELAKASESGDHAAVAELTDELVDLGKAAAAPRKAAETKTATVDYTKDPDFIAWKERQAWYGTDIAKTGIMDAISIKMRQEGIKDTGKAFLDELDRRYDKEIEKLVGPKPRADDKVEGGKGGTGGNTGGSGGNGKTYRDLPPDAKAACDQFEKKLVGPGKLHKDQAAWRKSYVGRYFTEA